MPFRYFLLFFLIFSIGVATAQTPESSAAKVFGLSLEELMNIEVMSASKKKENLFDAPLSASVLTKEEIKNAGCTSIMEAFRLIPGLIIREQTNGNYDVHIRGLDNVPPNSNFFNNTNTTTLVMVDGRPVYNYLTGGTFWSSIPIDLNDVERIEVVRGAVSAMYGPNAVSGVIQIITKKIAKKGLTAGANAQYGSFKTKIASASIGYRFSPKLSINFSTNYQTRDRQQTTYYSPIKHEWVIVDSLMKDYSTRYPDVNRSLSKFAANTFVQYTPKDKINIELCAGLQDSQMQTIIADNYITPLSNGTLVSQYINAAATIKQFTTQVSYTAGTQGVEGIRGWKYNYLASDVVSEYNITLKKLSLKPGLNYRKALYDDTPYSNIEKNEGFLNGRHQITTVAAFIRAEYSMLKEKLRLVGGLRADRFSYPKGIHPSFQFAASYKPGENHLFRLVVAKANRSPFIFDTYLNLRTERPSENPAIKIIADIRGNKDLDLLTLFNQEIGYRTKLADNLQLDVEVYRSFVKNYTDLINLEARDAYLQDGKYVLEVPVQSRNLAMSVRQMGGTISLNYVNRNFQLKPFIGYQDTHLFDYSAYNNTSTSLATAGNHKNPRKYNIHSGMGTEIYHRGTPALYGGSYINYQLNSKINFNVSPYFYTSQTFYALDNTKIRDGIRGIDKINAKFLINMRASYKVISKVELFLSAKNILNDQAREYYRSDKAGGSVLGGASFEF